MKKFLILAMIAAAAYIGYRLYARNVNDVTDSFTGLTSAQRPIGVPTDYFPTATGTTWEYEISADGQPLSYRLIAWPMGDQTTLTAVRGLHMGKVKTDQSIFRLAYAITGPGQPNAQIKWAGVQLKIIIDDLGVYEGQNGVTWALLQSTGFEVCQIVTYPPDSPGAPSGRPWGTWGAENGYEMRMIYFGKPPGTAISMGGESKDATLFIGPEQVSVGRFSGLALHFKRQVAADSSSVRDSELGQAFTEDMWYMRRYGLVRLRQVVGGRESMVWTLKKFTAGS